MANRRWSKNEQIEVGPDLPRPNPGSKSEKSRRFDSESSIPYKGAPEPKGHGYAKGPNYARVKTSIKEDY